MIEYEELIGEHPKKVAPSEDVHAICTFCGQDSVLKASKLRERIRSGRKFFCSRECYLQLCKSQRVVTDSGHTAKLCSVCGINTIKPKRNGEYASLCTICRRGSVMYSYTSTKHHARVRKIEFDLSFSEFASFWRKPCTYCGEQITTIGLDRVNNTKGYTFTNVISCCSMCNAHKGSDTEEQFLARCKRIHEKHGEALSTMSQE